MLSLSSSEEMSHSALWKMLQYFHLTDLAQERKKERPST